MDIISEKSDIRDRTKFIFSRRDCWLALHWIPAFYRGLEGMVNLQKEQNFSSNTNTSARDRPSLL